MTILPKEEADSDPVGEAQEEPNINPSLVKPTVGRGIVNVIAGGGMDWNFDFSWNPFGKLLPWLLCLFVFLCVICFIMYY